MITTTAITEKNMDSFRPLFALKTVDNTKGNDARYYFGAISDGTACGVVSFYLKNDLKGQDKGYVDYIYVAEENRRSGVGSALLEVVNDFRLDNDINTLIVIFPETVMSGFIKEQELEYDRQYPVVEIQLDRMETFPIFGYRDQFDRPNEIYRFSESAKIRDKLRKLSSMYKNKAEIGHLLYSENFSKDYSRIFYKDNMCAVIFCSVTNDVLVIDYLETTEVGDNNSDVKKIFLGTMSVFYSLAYELNLHPNGIKKIHCALIETKLIDTIDKLIGMQNVELVDYICQAEVY